MEYVIIISIYDKLIFNSILISEDGQKILYQHMRQVISIHVGQGGIQVGDASWQLFCIQHGIAPDGTVADQKQAELLKKDEFQKLFMQTGLKASNVNKFTPRAVFLDLEPDIINKMTIKNQGLLNPNQLIAGKYDSANIFARGYYTVGKEFIDICLQRIRNLAESCTDLQGFMIYNSVGGGTGSGFTSLLIQKLSAQYQKKIKIGFSIFPTPQISNAFMDPYNTILSSYYLMQNMSANIVFDNEAVHRISKQILGVQKPTYTNLNRIIAHVISSCTASFRSNGGLNFNLKQIQTNHVPYPRINFLFSSYAPLLPVYALNQKYTIPELTNTLFKPESMMVKCQPSLGKYMACSIGYRGSIVPKDVGSAICTIKTKRTIQFVDWCPTGFKVGINYQSPKYFQDEDFFKMDKSISSIFNTTAIKQLFHGFVNKFDKMYGKRAFVHWYLKEGMDQSVFNDARQDLAALEQDYLEVQVETEYQEGVQQG